MTLNLRYAVRRLAADPAFTLVAALSLALGIGANTAAFGLLHAVLLRAMPVRDPSALVTVATRTDATPIYGLSYPAYRHLRDRARGIETAIAFTDVTVNIREIADATDPAHGASGGAVDRASGMLVSGNYFDALGVPMAIGAPIRRDDDAGVVLSHSYWSRRFAADPSVVGRGLRLNGLPATIIGVAPSGFRGTRIGALPDVFLPIAYAPRLFDIPNRLENPRDRWLRVMARLAPGVTSAQAQGEMTTAFRHFNDERVIPLVTTEEARARTRRSTIVLAPGGSGLSELPSDVRPTLLILMGLVSVVLLLACVNVANLLVARAERQQRDTAVHVALGASGMRLWMQSFAECLILGATGLALGLLFATWMRGLLARLLPSGARLDASMDATVFGVAAALAFAAALFLAIAAGWQRRRGSLVRALKEGDVAARQWLRKGLIVGQLALSIVVIVAAALFTQTLRNLELVNPGFTRDRVLLASFDPRAYSRVQQRELYGRLFDEARATPGVIAAALANDAPLHLGIEWSMHLRGPRAASREWLTVPLLFVSPGYPDTMRIPLIAGRDLRDADLAQDAPPVMLVNEAFVARHLTTSSTQPSSAIGQRVRSANREEAFEIVGVVRDSRVNGLRDAVEPAMYLPMTANALAGRVVLHLRTAVPAAPVAATIDANIRRTFPDVTMFDVRTLEEHVAQATGRERTFAQLSSVFGLLALALAAVGLYGIMAYAVSRRRRELGIRLALGASRAGVVGLVLREAIWLAAFGLLTGLPLAYALGGAVRGLLYGVAPGDWRGLAASSLLLALVVIAAAWLPARRAARVDPLIALRYD